MIRLVLVCLALLSQWAVAAQVLPPQLAFKPQVRALDGQRIEVRFEIARGYYLYGDKFRFQIDDEGVTLGAAMRPKGKVVQDDTFGRVEVYYDSVRLTLPVSRAPGPALSSTQQVTTQGCADVGVCYTPQRQSLTLELPALVPGARLTGNVRRTLS